MAAYATREQLEIAVPDYAESVDRDLTGPQMEQRLDEALLAGAGQIDGALRTGRFSPIDVPSLGENSAALIARDNVSLAMLDLGLGVTGGEGANLPQSDRISLALQNLKRLEECQDVYGVNRPAQVVYVRPPEVQKWQFSSP